MIGRVALEVIDIVIAVVAAQIGAAVFPPHQLQPHGIGAKPDCRVHIAGAEPDIPDIDQINHRISSLWNRRPLTAPFCLDHKIYIWPTKSQFCKLKMGLAEKVIPSKLWIFWKGVNTTIIKAKT